MARKPAKAPKRAKAKARKTRQKPQQKPAIRPAPAPSADYQPEFCAKVVALGKEGNSRTQIAVALGVTRRALNVWIEEHDDFAEACELADDHAQAFFEELGQKGIKLGHRFNDRTWWNIVRCRFSEHYKDAKEVELSGSIGGDPVKVVISAAEVGV